MPQMTVKQLAVKYGLSRALIYLWVEERRFSCLRVGSVGRRGRILIEEQEFLSFLNTLKVPASPPPTPARMQHIRM
jgi:hypothetical protein